MNSSAKLRKNFRPDEAASSAGKDSDANKGQRFQRSIPVEAAHIPSGYPTAFEPGVGWCIAATILDCGSTVRGARSK